jgi:hypothetical protein
MSEKEEVQVLIFSFGFSSLFVSAQEVFLRQAHPGTSREDYA